MTISVQRFFNRIKVVLGSPSRLLVTTLLVNLQVPIALSIHGQQDVPVSVQCTATAQIVQ